MSEQPSSVQRRRGPVSLAGRRWLLAVWALPLLGVLWTVCRAPDWLEPRLLTVALEPGQSAVLGGEALWAPQADSGHIALRREANGAWRLTNISLNKRVLRRSAMEGDHLPIREWPLADGASFAVGAQAFVVSSAERNRLILQSGDLRWEYDGVRLRRDGQLLPECLQGWRTRLRAWLGELGLPLGLLQRPLRLGGGVYCADRLGLAGVPLDTVVIEPTPTGFALCPGGAGRWDGFPVTVAAGTPDAESLWQRSVSLAAGDRLIVGRTQYRVTRTEPALELAVVARAQRWLAGSPPPVVSPMVAVEWSAPAWWRPPDPRSLDWRFGIVLAPLALGLMGSGWRRGGRPDAGDRWRIGLALTLAAACFAMHWKALTVPVLWPYLIAWPALWVWLKAVRSPWSVGLLAVLTLLLGGGLVALLQLGVGAGDAGWQRYGGSGAALAGAFGWLAWAGWKGRRWLRPFDWPANRLMYYGLPPLIAGSLALLAAQVVSGDEGGWRGLQPFELAKLMLVVAAAYPLALRARSPLHGWSFDRSAPWLLYLGPLGLLVAVCGFALMFLRDFSPLVLLVFWSLMLVWAYLRAHPFPVWRRAGQSAVIALAVLLAAGLVGLRERPEALPPSFKADRIRVWAAPEHYPHAGYQLRRALEAIRAGGWAGTVWSEPANGRVMTVPVVANDFTPAFFLNRYGGLAGLVLVGIQAVFIGLLIMIANRALARSEPDDSGPAMAAGFSYFTLYGGAALLGAHFLVSWGTNLGFLPVMGQPMSLLSAAGSHLVLFVLPIVALAVAVEEKNHDHPP